MKPDKRVGWYEHHNVQTGEWKLISLEEYMLKDIDEVEILKIADDYLKDKNIDGQT